MKSIVYSSIFLILSLVMLSCAADNTIDQGTVPEWKILGSAGQGTIIGNYLDLAVDLHDYPVVVYQDMSSSIQAATALRWDGTVWTLLGNIGFSTGPATYVSLAITSYNNPVITYQDSSASWSISVMAYTGSSWTLVGDKGFSDGQADFTRIAIGSDNAPVVAYRDSANGSKITVQKWNSGTSSWSPVGNKGFSSGSPRDLCLALYSNNFPIVAYIDLSDNRPKAMKYNGSPVWEVIGTGSIDDTGAASISLAIDSTDHPVVAYVDLAHKISVKRWDGIHWVFIGSPAFPPAETYESIDLAINSLNQPLVAFISNDNRKAMVMQWDGNSWVTLGEGGISEGEAELIRIDLTKTDKPIIAFKDLSHEGKLTAMIYE